MNTHTRPRYYTPPPLSTHTLINIKCVLSKNVKMQQGCKGSICFIELGQHFVTSRVISETDKMRLIFLVCCWQSERLFRSDEVQNQCHLSMIILLSKVGGITDLWKASMNSYKSLRDSPQALTGFTVGRLLPQYAPVD